MQLKKQFFIAIPALLCLSLTTSCYHRITRSGYTPTATSNPCDVQILTQKTFKLNAPVEKKGVLELGDTGASVHCSRERAMKIIKDEACSAGANIANIVSEEKPDIISSCYRARVEFFYSGSAMNDILW